MERAIYEEKPRNFDKKETSFSVERIGSTAVWVSRTCCGFRFGKNREKNREKHKLKKNPKKLKNLTFPSFKAPLIKLLILNMF